MWILHFLVWPLPWPYPVFGKYILSLSEWIAVQFDFWYQGSTYSVQFNWLFHDIVIWIINETIVKISPYPCQKYNYLTVPLIGLNDCIFFFNQWAVCSHSCCAAYKTGQFWLQFLKKCWNIDIYQMHWLNKLRGYCTPGQFLDCFCIFLTNYNTLVTSKICFL